MPRRVVVEARFREGPIALPVVGELDPKSRSLPVLLLTTEVQPSLTERAKKAGARGWMVKPINLEQFVATVRKVVA